MALNLATLNARRLRDPSKFARLLGELSNLRVNVSAVHENHFTFATCLIGWGCRLYRLLLCRGVRPPPNGCPGYDTKQSDGEVPAMLELLGMRSTHLLQSLPGEL